MYAAIFNNLEIFKLVYEKAPSSLKEETSRSINALDYIGMHNRLEIYKYLIEEKDIDINEMDSRGRTAFMIACANNKKEIIDYCLFKRVNINKVDDQKKSGIVYATIYDYLDLVEDIIIFAQKESIKNNVDFQHNLLVSLLASIELYNENKENFTIFNTMKLIMKNLINININDEGTTLLSYSLYKKNYKLIKLFLEREEINLFEKIDEYDNVIEAAIFQGDVAALELMINKLSKDQILSNIGKWKKIIENKDINKEVKAYIKK